MEAGCGGERGGVVNGGGGHTYPLAVSLSPWSNSLSIDSQQENVLKDKCNKKLHVLLMQQPSPKPRAKKNKINKLFEERKYEECCQSPPFRLWWNFVFVKLHQLKT